MTTKINEDVHEGGSHEAQALVMHGDNTTHLEHTSKVPVMKNLEKKFKKGTYDHTNAKKLWGYHADRVAQSYAKEHGHPSAKWHEMFSTKHRKEAATHWADEHHAEMQAGDFHESVADEIVGDLLYGVMEGKPRAVADALTETMFARTTMLIAEQKAELSGRFIEAWDNGYETPPSKRGMWNGYSKQEIKKAETAAKKNGNVKREREAIFALRAKNHFGKATVESKELEEASYQYHNIDMNMKGKGKHVGYSEHDHYHIRQNNGGWEAVGQGNQGAEKRVHFGKTLGEISRKLEGEKKGKK